MPPLFLTFRIMRNIKSLLFALVAFTLIVACGNKKSRPATAEDFIRPASMDYSKQDTADINYLVNTYVGYFDKGNLDGCADMLYTFHQGNVVPYTKEKKDSFKNAFAHFNIYGSKVKSVILRSDRNNQVDIAVQIIRDGDLDKGVGVTTLSLNPVVVEGKWYLTLLDKNAEGVEDVYKAEVENARRQ